MYWDIKKETDKKYDTLPSMKNMMEKKPVIKTLYFLDSELYQQYINLEQEIILQKKLGTKRSGRTREIIAEALQVSTSQVSKMEKINRYAIDEIKNAVCTDKMSISTANDVAKLCASEQTELVSKIPLSEISAKRIKEYYQEEI